MIPPLRGTDRADRTPLLVRRPPKVERIRRPLVIGVCIIGALVVGLSLVFSPKPAPPVSAISRSSPRSPPLEAAVLPDASYAALVAAEPAVGHVPGREVASDAADPSAAPEARPADAAAPILYGRTDGAAPTTATVRYASAPNPGPNDPSPRDLHRPASPSMIMAGDVIPAALITAIDSDLPGEVVAQVTGGVFDHATGRSLLIPQGSRLVGQYDSHLAYGQVRATVLWNRIIYPDGRSVDLGAMVGGDLTGASGLTDRVDSHIGPILRAVALSTAITVGGVAAQSTTPRSSGALVVNDAASGAAVHASEASGRFIDRDLSRQPTIKVRAGWPLTVIVSHDLALEPYVTPGVNAS